MLDHIASLSRPVAHEHHLVRLENVGKRILVENHCLRLDNSFKGRIVGGCINFHATRIYHGDIEQLVLIDKVVEHSANHQQLQGVDTYQGHLETESKPLGFAEANAQAGIRTGTNAPRNCI